MLLFRIIVALTSILTGAWCKPASFNFKILVTAPVSKAVVAVTMPSGKVVRKYGIYDAKAPKTEWRFGFGLWDGKAAKSDSKKSEDSSSSCNDGLDDLLPFLLLSQGKNCGKNCGNDNLMRTLLLLQMLNKGKCGGSGSGSEKKSDGGDEDGEDEPDSNDTVAKSGNVSGRQMIATDGSFFIHPDVGPDTKLPCWHPPVEGFEYEAKCNKN